MERLRDPDPLPASSVAAPMVGTHPRPRYCRGALLVTRPPRLPAAGRPFVPAAEVPPAARGGRARAPRPGPPRRRRAVDAARDRARPGLPRARAARRAQPPRGARARAAVVAAARRARTALDAGHGPR